MKFQTEALQIIAEAQAAKHPDWANAIKKATHQLTNNPAINLNGETLFIVSDSGWIYAVGAGDCQCKAFRKKVPCWHRAARGLVLEYQEKHPAASLLSRLRGALPIVRASQHKAAAQAQAQTDINELFA